MALIIVAADDRAVQDTLCVGLGEEGFNTVSACSADTLMTVLEKEDVDVLVASVPFCNSGATRILTWVRRVDRRLPVILVTDDPGTESAVEAVRGGAFDYLIRPVPIPELLDAVSTAAVARAQEVERARAAAGVWAQEQLAQSLGKRVQELECLYDVTKLMVLGRPVDQVLDAAVRRLPAAWRHAAVAVARIVVDDQTYQTDGFTETPWQQRAEILVEGQGVGHVTVGYLEARPAAEEGPFLSEERQLLDTLASHIGEFVAHRRFRRRMLHTNAMLKGIRKVNHLVGTEHDPARLAELACDELVVDQGYSRAWLARFNPAGKVQEVHVTGVSSPVEAFRKRILEGWWPPCAARAVETRQTVRIDDPLTGCTGCILGEEEPEGVVLTRLLSQRERIYGVLTVALPRDCADHDDLVTWFEHLCGDLAAAFHRLDLEAGKKQSDQDYAKLFNAISHGVALCRPLEHGDDFVLVDINDAGARIGSVSRADAVGGRVTEVFPSIRAMGLMEVLRRVSRTGLPEQLGPVQFSVGGAARWYSNHVYRAAGKDLVVLFEDVTELETARRRLELAMKAGGVGLWDWNPKTGHLHVSSEYKAQIGYRSESIQVDRTEWERRLHPDDREDTIRAVEDSLAGRVPHYEAEFRLRHRDGTYRWIYAKGEVIRNAAGRPQRMIGCHVDITARKTAEEERLAVMAQLRTSQRTEAIGILAAGVAHEVNNPINGIMNYAQLVEDEAGTAETIAHYAREIIAETERVAAIVRNLLAVARHVDPVHTPESLHDVVSRPLSLMNTVLHQDGIEVNSTIPDDLPMIECKAGEIEQVIMSLLTNARDALLEKTDEGDCSRVIRLSAQTVEVDGKPGVRLSVEDNGPGLTDYVCSHLADPFFTTKGRALRTGLGVYVSYNIVKEHGGELHWESEPGEYTRFHVDLPATHDR